MAGFTRLIKFLGDKFLYGHVPDPIPRCVIGSGHVRLYPYSHDDYTYTVNTQSEQFLLSVMEFDFDFKYTLSYHPLVAVGSPAMCLQLEQGASIVDVKMYLDGTDRIF